MTLKISRELSKHVNINQDNLIYSIGAKKKKIIKSQDTIGGQKNQYAKYQ